MNENEKIEFLKKVLDIYKYYGEDATAERKSFLFRHLPELGKRWQLFFLR